MLRLMLYRYADTCMDAWMLYRYADMLRLMHGCCDGTLIRARSYTHTQSRTSS
jgi:hypothetical protein